MTVIEHGMLSLLQTPTIKITPTSAVVLAPTESFQACLKRMILKTKMLSNNKLGSTLTPAALRRNSIACLLPYATSQEVVMPVIQDNWQVMVDGELALWCDSEELFPKQRGFEQAQGWFHYELHPVVYALLDRDDLLHTQSVMLLLVRPKPAFIEWLNENKQHLSVEQENVVERFSQEALLEHAPAYLIPRVASRRELSQYLTFFARDIFANECSIWCAEEKYWPKNRDAMSFDQYFTVEPHVNLLDFMTH